ncbi:MAG: DcaP family trimeric outer membrane transporter [Pseudomonadota bacterium]
MKLKTILVSGAAAIVAGGAFAQSESLEDRIAALEAMVVELKAELEAEREDIVRIEMRSEEAIQTVTGMRERSGFSVGDATLSFGGFVDFDAHVTSLSDGAFAPNSVTRDFYIPGATPIGGEETTTTDFTAEATRFFLDGSQDVGGKKVSGHIEMDFLLSAQGNQRVSNSYSPRLRRAYLDIDGKWRIGQEWSTFQNTSAIPESASFLILSDGMIFERQALLRYTNGPWQVALENGNATITSLDGSRIEADGNLVPDVIARYNHTGELGTVSFAAIARQLRLETGLIDEETFGWGVSASGRISVGEKDDIRFNLAGGEGLGRYIGLNAFNGAAIDPADGSLEAIASYGGLVAWRHPFGETARFNLGYSGLFADNPDFIGDAATKSVQSVYGAILWDVAPKVTLGTEIMAGVRELESGDDGNITRVTFSTKYAF